MLLRHKSARNLVRVLKIHEQNQDGSMARWVTGLQGLGGVEAIHRKRGYSAFAMHFTMREASFVMIFLCRTFKGVLLSKITNLYCLTWPAYL